jgi:hypothetical protein
LDGQRLPDGVRADADRHSHCREHHDFHRGERARFLPLGLDSTLPLSHIQTTDACVDDSLRHERPLATLSAILSVLETLVAGVGLYGRPLTGVL